MKKRPVVQGGFEQKYENHLEFPYLETLMVTKQPPPPPTPERFDLTLISRVTLKMKTKSGLLS